MKIYLNELTPEQVIKELKEGKVAVSKSGNSVQMIDGVIIEFTKDSYFLGACVFVGVDEVLSPEYYFTYEDPFTVSEEKYYKTKDGRKAFVCGKSPTKVGKFYVSCEGVPGVYPVDGYGVSLKDSLSLVEEWKE